MSGPRTPRTPIKADASSRRRKFAVFRGNGASYLHAAFARRESRWARVTTSDAASSGLSKLEANLLLSKALREGGVSFVFRDLLHGPLWVPGSPPAPGEATPMAALHAVMYPSLADGQAQVVNRWPRHASLTSKDGSLGSLEQYYRAQGLNPWAFVPLSFAVPNVKLTNAELGANQAWRCVCAAYSAAGCGADPRVAEEQGRANLWLLKPTNGSGGEGIVVSSELAELERALGSARASIHGFICQKYIEEPMLFDGRKLDLRLWAILADDPGSPIGLRCYAYREGYARTSSERFTLPARSVDGASASSLVSSPASPPAKGPPHDAAAAEAHSRLVHLTNYCMQVQGANCGNYEEGNAVSFDDLDAQLGAGLSFRQTILPHLYALVADAALASRRELLQGLRDHGRGRRICALLGFDFMVSARGAPFLIECNANPLLAAQNPWHDLLVGRMVDDYVAIAADGTFFSPTATPSPRPPLDGIHCKERAEEGETAPGEAQGSGFVQLLGRPTAAHRAPLFGVTTVGGVLVLHRSEEERAAAAAVEEPPSLPPSQPPSPPPTLLPMPSLSPPLAPGAPSASLTLPMLVRGLQTAVRPSRAPASITRIQSEAAAAAAGARERRMAALRYAATHRAAAALSVPKC